ncbi:MAG: hypothetical protein ACKVS9_12335 [Phycisphaerae bacterium]
MMTVFHVDPVGSNKIGFAVAKRAGTFWEWQDEGLIDPSAYLKFTDPVAAYNPNTGEFLVVAMGTDDQTVYGWTLLLSRWNPLTSALSPWEELTTLPTEVDKPWIVRGNPNEVASLPFGQMSMSFGQWAQTEFYIVWHDQTDNRPFGLGYLRSTDDGHTWIGGDVLGNVNDPASRALSTRGWPLPRVHEDRPLYVAHVDAPLTGGGYCTRYVRVLRGDDRTDFAHLGEVQFSNLVDDATGITIRIDLNAGSDNMLFRLAGLNLYQSGSGQGVGVDFAVDPANEAKLYLVYHDTAGTCSDDLQVDDGDVNIYMRVLTHVTGSRWSVGPQILVADDGLVEETDQFMPQVVVDGRGHIHVIFYSDVNYPIQEDGPSLARFDVWYAYSDDGGDNWLLQELCEYAGEPTPCVGPDPDPAIDSALPHTDIDFLRDYTGIAVGENEVWTSFMGITDDDTANPDKSVIFSTRISRN